MFYRADLLCGNKYVMYNMSWFANNNVCSCLYVLLWGNFICRMHIQTCITFHKRNLSSYFLIIVSSHHYTYPTAYDQLVYELFVCLRCTYHPLFFLIYEMILLLCGSSCKLMVVLCSSFWLSMAPESSQMQRILPHNYTVCTEETASQHASLFS